MNKKLKRRVYLLLEKVSPKTKRNIKRILHMKVSEYKTIIRTSTWVTQGALAYERTLKRKGIKRITTNIKIQKSLPLLSICKDQFLEAKLKSGFYTFRDLLVVTDPYEMAPLTALVLFYTEKESFVRFKVKGITVGDDISGQTVLARYHRVPVIGLYAGIINTVILELFDSEGNLLGRREIFIKTARLPKDLSDIIQVKPSTRESALPLIFITGGGDIRTCAFDRAGNIRYYLMNKAKGYGVFPISQGKFLFLEKDILVPSYSNPHSIQMYEMDLFGRAYKTFLIEKGVHHNACEKGPGGNFLMPGSSLKGHLEDCIIEIDRDNGQIVKTFDFRYVFDEKFQDMFDWAHVNAVSYNEEEHTVLASLRNVHAGIKINWDTNGVEWILADPRFFEGTEEYELLLQPIGDVKWHYQAHAIYEIKENLDGNPNTKHIIVFDNHWHKRRPVPFFDHSINSYVLIYTVDEAARTIKMEHSYCCPKSKIRSNGLFLYDKRRVFAMEGYLAPEIDGNLGKICEFEYESEKLINEYYVKPGFFSARDFQIDYELLGRAMEIESEYIVGELKPPVQGELPEVAETDKFEEELQNRIFICEDTFYIKQKDHSIHRVYFVGRKHTYMRNYTDTEQTNPALFGEAIYYVAIPLKMLLKDRYLIYVEYGNSLVNTGQYIKIK